MQITSSSLTTADTHILTVAISMTRGDVNVAPRNARSKLKPLLDEKYRIQISIYGMEGVSILSNVVWGMAHAVWAKKYAHGFCFAVLCCGYTLTDFPISNLTIPQCQQSNPDEYG